MHLLTPANPEHLVLSVPITIASCALVALLLPTILRSRKLFLWCSAIGLVLPWLVGIAVKLWLQSRGLPTYPYSDFFNMAWLCVAGSVMLAFPLMMFGLYAQRVLATRPCYGLNTQRARNCLIGGVLIGAVASMSLTFVDLFWKFDFLSMFFAPFWWIGYIDGVAVGALAGWATGRWIQKRETESRTRSRHEKSGNRTA